MSSTHRSDNSVCMIISPVLTPTSTHFPQNHLRTVILKDDGTIIRSKWTVAHCPGHGPSPEDDGTIIMMVGITPLKCTIDCWYHGGGTAAAG